MKVCYVCMYTQIPHAIDLILAFLGHIIIYTVMKYDSGGYSIVSVLWCVWYICVCGVCECCVYNYENIN